MHTHSSVECGVRGERGWAEPTEATTGLREVVRGQRSWVWNDWLLNDKRWFGGRSLWVGHTHTHTKNNNMLRDAVSIGTKIYRSNRR